MFEFLQSISHFGEILAVATALAWAIAVIFFKKSGEHAHPIALNLFKNLLAFGLIFVTMMLLDIPFIPKDVPFRDYIILILAGALGIGIGDTIFFKGLNILGAGLSAIVACIYSPTVIVLSVIFLDEKLTLPIIVGATLILSAIILTASRKGTKHLPKSELYKGISLILLSQIVMVIGIIASKRILDANSILWTSQIRFIGGLLMILIMLIFNPHRKSILGSLRGRHNWKFIFAGSFFGAYLALILWLGGMKYTQVSIAAVLNQLSEIFILVLAAIFLKEKITGRKTVAIILAFLGAILVTL